MIGETVRFLSHLILLIYFSVLGLCCCMPAFSSCGEGGPLSSCDGGLLLAVAFLVAEHAL